MICACVFSEREKRSQNTLYVQNVINPNIIIQNTTHLQKRCVSSRFQFQLIMLEKLSATQYYTVAKTLVLSLTSHTRTRRHLGGLAGAAVGRHHGAAERTGDVRPEPPVHALGVEPVPAPRQYPAGLAVPELA